MLFLLFPLLVLSQRLPDFVPDSDHLQSTLSIDYIDAAQDVCLVNEKCLNGYGMRKILRFATMIHNRGNGDAFLGAPPSDRTSPSNAFYW
jgi:hypothetical protein